MWVAVGIAVAGIAGAAISSTVSAGAQKSAADTQAAAAGNATQVQYNEWQQQQTNMQPWLTQGTSAVNQLGALMAPGGSLAQTTPTLNQLQMDPGYAWRTQQGNDQITAAGAAAGNLGSGNMGVALQNYGQNAASAEYQNAYNRWENGQNTLYNRLAGVAGTGQTAANQLGQAGQNMANNVGQNMVGAGNAIAAGQIGSANAWANGINGAGNQLMDGIGAYQQNQLYQNYLNNGQLYNQAGGNINNVDFGASANDMSTLNF